MQRIPDETAVLILVVLALPVVGLVAWGLAVQPLLVAPVLVVALAAGAWLWAAWRRVPEEAAVDALPRLPVLAVLVAGSTLVFAAGLAVFERGGP